MKNKYEIRGDVTAIFIRRKDEWIETIIDTEDLPIAQKYKNTWCSDVYGYVYSSDKKNKLHRCIMLAPSGTIVDHINHNVLDNRKANLRIGTHAQNMQNIKGAHKRNKTSGVRGVSWNKGMKKWHGRVMVNRKRIDLGYFETLEDAKNAAENARSKLMEFSKEAMDNVSLGDVVVHSPHKSNIKSGIKGIHWDKNTESWRVQFKGKKLSKRFKNLEDAKNTLYELKSTI